MSAQETASREAAKFVAKFNEVILIPFIGLLAAVAFLVFIWGCAQYIFNAANENSREEGIKHITWGIIGLVIMMTAWGIMQVATGTFGLNDELDCAKDPSGPGCAGKFTP